VCGSGSGSRQSKGTLAPGAPFVCADKGITLTGRRLVYKKTLPLQNVRPIAAKIMIKETAIKLFENRKVCSAWDADAEKWYISIVDVIGVLTESVDGRKYWNKLKQRLKEEGNETVTNCHQLKLPATNGKMRLTDE
jgi:hypothetical protein